MKTIALLSSLFFSCLSLASLELVENAPIETNLQVQGIRTTADVWVEMIKSAKKTLDIEQFYVSTKDGQSLQPILNAIEEAATRGVQVRLLVDAGMYKTYPAIPDRFSTLGNMNVETIDYSSHGGIQHSKYFIVDGSDAYVGSANFDWLALTHIHEVGLRITDAAAGEKLEAIFSHDWQQGNPLGRKSLPAPTSKSLTNGTEDFQILASPKSENPDGVGETLPVILNMIQNAKSSVKLQVYEFTTKIYKSSEHWDDLKVALQDAASRGVQVSILVDKNALKEGQKDLNALGNLSNVEVRVVTIPEWSGGHLDYARLVHSKYLIVDNAQAWVGSENWSQNYFFGCRNVGLQLQDTDIIAKLGQVYDTLWNSEYISKLKR